jgi:lipoprotein-anchoring transpeptidase ErfK/SrfK
VSAKQTGLMSMQNSYSLMSRAAVAFAVVAGAACASGGSSSGAYVPPLSKTSSVAVGGGSSWAGEPSGVHINVDLSERKLYLKNGDEVVRAYEIGVGQAGYPTPEGNYSIRRIVWNPPWTPPDAAWAADKEPQAPGAANNPMKVVKIYFNEPDYYIHGTGSVSTLGGAVSHGCLRMAPEDAASLARYLMEHGGDAHDAAWFDHVQSSNETTNVTLESSIPMHVAQ